MRCKICSKKTDFLFSDNSPICESCAKERGYTVCTETGTYKDFECSYVCNDCEFKNENN